MQPYHKLQIFASSPNTDIWLGDDTGHFVQKAQGKLKTNRLSGDYVVDFGLGTTTYPIHVTEASQHTQAEIVAGPSRPRPLPQVPPDSDPA